MLWRGITQLQPRSNESGQLGTQSRGVLAWLRDSRSAPGGDSKGWSSHDFLDHLHLPARSFRYSICCQSITSTDTGQTLWCKHACTFFQRIEKTSRETFSPPKICNMFDLIQTVRFRDLTFGPPLIVSVVCPCVSKQQMFHACDLLFQGPACCSWSSKCLRKRSSGVKWSVQRQLLQSTS